jgi:hypothetical protein
MLATLTAVAVTVTSVKADARAAALVRRAVVRKRMVKDKKIALEVVTQIVTADILRRMMGHLLLERLAQVKRPARVEAEARSGAGHRVPVGVLGRRRHQNLLAARRAFPWSLMSGREKS